MIEFSEVTKSYTVGTHALRGIDLQIEDGEFVFLVGPSPAAPSMSTATPWSASVSVRSRIFAVL